MAYLMVAVAAASGSCFQRLPAMLLHLLQLPCMLLLQDLQGSPLLALQLLNGPCMLLAQPLQAAGLLFCLLSCCPTTHCNKAVEILQANRSSFDVLKVSWCGTGRLYFCSRSCMS